MQLVISPGLLDAVRKLDKPNGRLLCEQIGSDVLLVRGLVGRDAEAERYPDLHIEQQSGAQIEVRLAWVLAEPPQDDSPMLLLPRLPLGMKRLEEARKQPPQPFLETLLEKEPRLLAVGTTEAQLLFARPSFEPISRVWFRGDVVETPPRPTEAGLDPFHRLDNLPVQGSPPDGGAAPRA